MNVYPHAHNHSAKDRQEGREFDWTRRGPLPDLPQPRRVPTRSSFGRNVEAASDAGSDRGGGRRNFESDGKFRDFSNWERKGPLAPTGGGGREGGRPRSNEGSAFRKNSPAALGEARSQDGSRPPRREIQPPSAAELDTEWRARMRPDPPATKEPSAPSSPAAASPASPAPAPSAPATRPKLNLQKRTVSESPAAPIGGESKASPFGGARPTDTAAREREIEEKRGLAIRQKKEHDEKTKAEKAEKAEKQKQAKSGGKAAPSAGDPNGRDVSETPQGGKNFDILRQAGEDDNDGVANHETESQAGDGPGEPQEIEEAQANGTTEGPEEPVDDEGWSTVGKQRNNRRGRAAA